MIDFFMTCDFFCLYLILLFVVLRFCVSRGSHRKSITILKTKNHLSSPLEGLSINSHEDKKIKNWISICCKIEIQSLSMGLSIMGDASDASLHRTNHHFFGFSSSKIMLRRLPIGTRTCCIVSRSRTVTQLSTKVSLSTVTHIGVPMASWRR